MATLRRFDCLQGLRGLKRDARFMTAGAASRRACVDVRLGPNRVAFFSRRPSASTLALASLRCRTPTVDDIIFQYSFLRTFSHPIFRLWQVQTLKKVVKPISKKSWKKDISYSQLHIFTFLYQIICTYCQIETDPGEKKGVCSSVEGCKNEWELIRASDVSSDDGDDDPRDPSL